MDKALIIVDMLNDFIRPDGRLYFPEARGIIPAVAGLRAGFAACGLPVAYSNDAHPEDSAEFKVWPPHCVAGTEGARVVDELAPGPDDGVYPKDSLRAFDNPDLETDLRAAGARELFVCGTATEYCVREAVIGALARGFAVFVVEDAIAGVDLRPGDVDRATDAMLRAGARFVDTREALELAGCTAPETSEA